MNSKARQYLALAALFRKRAAQFEQGFVSKGTALPDNAIPQTVTSQQVLDYAREAIEAATDAEACRGLEVRCIYGAVMADPDSEREILNEPELELLGDKMERLKRYGVVFSRRVADHAQKDKKYQQEMGQGKGARWLRVALALLLLLVVGLGVAGGLTYRSASRFLRSAPRSDNEKVKLKIPRGATARKVARILKRKKLIRSERLFFLFLRYHRFWRKAFPSLRRARPVRAGNYRIKTGLTPPKLLVVLGKGPRKPSVRVTIPEGFNVWKIAARMEARGICEKRPFLRLARSSDYARKLLGYSAPNLEGYLYPDTYRFHKGTPVEKVLRRMVRIFKRVFKKKWKKRARELELSVHQVVTLASVVEKETGAPKERKIIASVFFNRLKRKWKLESDPTTIYGLLPNFNGDLTARDLHAMHPYNTYKHRGLPPGPIASVGKAAIKAVLWPAKTRYMFFVARGDGTHAFSRTKAQHQRYVIKYQLKGRKPRKR